MSDPAVEAVKRADSDGWLRPAEYAEEAAREALAPIRELHKPQMDTRSALHPEPACSCGTGSDWRDCPTAQQVYTTEELEAGHAQ